MQSIATDQPLIGFPTRDDPYWIGTRLVDEGRINKQQLDLAIDYFHKQPRKGFSKAILELGLANHVEVAALIAEKFQCDLLDLDTLEIDRAVAALLSPPLARNRLAIPYKKEGNVMFLAVADPASRGIEPLRKHFQDFELKIAVAPESDIIAKVDELNREEVVVKDASHFLDDLIKEAVYKRASDIHLESKENVLEIRLRIDGQLNPHAYVRAQQRDQVVSRAKILGEMNITEKRLPQDGRATFTIGSKKINLRLCSVPTSFGESVVIRILDQTKGIQSFEQLGISREHIAVFQHELNTNSGVIYLTGPTGSGKTTTLYSALDSLDSVSNKILTLEDPVEYLFLSIEQVEINERIGLTFSAGLRSFLRQDPDVILVGETRDQETAQLTMRAALTGHLVLSTVHTNNALGAVPRLLDLGIEPFLIASGLRLLVGQRLVRMLCSKCRIIHSDSAAFCEKYHIEGCFFEAVGCPACQGKAYQGRTGIFEFYPTKDMENLILNRASDEALEASVRSKQLPSILNDGINKAANGITTLAQVFSVI